MSEIKKIAIITGASKGIGYATARLFVDKGYKVLNLSRTVCAIDAVDNIRLDFLQKEWAESLLTRLMDAISGVEQVVLVHNAAMMTKESVSGVNTQALRDALEVNVIAPARLNTLLLGRIPSGSSVIYIGSTLSHKAVANTHNYVLSKHALLGQMRATCQDLAGKGIHTACICPGFTETEMLKSHLGQRPEVLKSITDNIALQRLVQPKEIADTVWFCAQNPAINGAVIDANLGQIER